MTKCAVCGNIATTSNEAGIPVCSRCQRKKVQIPKCPMCDAVMALRSGKYGSFWGCPRYPACVGTKKLGER